LTAALAGADVVLSIVALSSLAVLYAVPWPVTPMGRWRIRRIKDVPLSKSLCMAAGWATRLIASPLLADPALTGLARGSLEPAAWACGAVFLQVYCRGLRMDFQDSLGDRIFGRRTAVTLLGWRCATRLLKTVLVVWTLFLAVAAIRFPGSPFPLLILSGPLYNLALLPELVKKGSLSGYLFDAALDSQFLAAGLMVLAWSSLH
jgi:hypothetical protein